MEGSCLTFTAPSTPSRPSIYLHHDCSFSGQFHSKTHFIRPSKTATLKGFRSLENGRRKRRDLCVEASIPSIPDGRPTLSSNWDVSSYAAPSWLPRFEELDSTNMLLRQRIIFLGSPIDDTTADFIITQLLLLDAQDPKKDIKLFINSPGGNITDAMAIYDGMKLCKADISTICMGLAASVAGFILAAGSKGKRFCMPNSRVMIHQPYGSASGPLTDFAIRTRELAYQKIKLCKILSRITGKSEEQIEADTLRDNFMNPWEAKEYGLVDAVIDDGKPGLVAPTSDVLPPPKAKVWRLWEAKGIQKGTADLPSEERFLQNGYAGDK